MAGPFAGGGTGAVAAADPAAVAAAADGWPSSAAAGTAAAVSPAAASRERRVSGRRMLRPPGSGLGEVIRAVPFSGRTGRDDGPAESHDASLDLFTCARK